MTDGGTKDGTDELAPLVKVLEYLWLKLFVFLTVSVETVLVDVVVDIETETDGLDLWTAALFSAVPVLRVEVGKLYELPPFGKAGSIGVLL